MLATLTLADLTARTGLDVLGHLEREVTIPVTDGIQAQGDLLVIPIALLVTELRSRAPRNVSIADPARWHEVAGSGIEVLRAGTGGNPHTLVADPGTCRWTTGVHDRERLALGALTTTGVAYLIHPEHGSGIAPGTYVIRRQRERSGGGTRLSSFPYGANPTQYIAD
jgi:hypothetical protein